MQDEFFFVFPLESMYFRIFESPSIGFSSHFSSVKLQTFEALCIGIPHFLCVCFIVLCRCYIFTN